MAAKGGNGKALADADQQEAVDTGVEAPAAEAPKPSTATKAASSRKEAASGANGKATAAKRGAQARHELAKKRHDDEIIRSFFESGEYPYKTKMQRKAYEKHKAELQVELLKVQRWVKESGERIMILFEGRDAAGKGGTIKRFMEHLNPRGARLVALEKPSRRRSAASGISSATSATCRPPARWSCSTAPGTTGPASSG